MVCAVCDYPFRSKTDLVKHQGKHSLGVTEIDENQNCGLCGYEFSSNNEFRNHIKIKHSTQFNCTHCSFQGSSKVILTKHVNLSHRNEEEQEEGTFRCTECKQQFSSKWNLKNHIRDNHEKRKDCEFYRIGSCQFPDTVCWDKHEKNESSKTTSNDKFECHTCRKTFQSRHVVMVHRLNEHPEKIKPCREQENCTRQVCWYKHQQNKASEKNYINNSWISDELDSETVDFQEAPVIPKPPLTL